MLIRTMSLRNWKHRRIDKKTEEYWKKREEKHGELNPYEQYQKEWNFIETDYNDRPSNNGLDLAHPKFAFETKLAKYLVPVEVEIGDEDHLP
jgi:hypothetical protein